MRAAAGLVLVLAVLLPTPARAGASFERYSYTGPQGSLEYKVYLPATRGPGPPSLVVVLHGGGETADTAATRSQWNRVADRGGFLVAYPEQNPEYSNQRIWDWAGSAADGRAGRETSLISGLTRAVVSRWHADRRRVYIVGMSAGAGMASVMAVVYPDVYAAAGIYAGCPFDFVTCGGSSTDAESSADAAVVAMGAYARIVPVLNVYGSADPIARGTRADLVVPTWLAVADRLDDGANNGSVTRTAADSRLETPLPPEHPYQVSAYRDRFGCRIGEDWLVHGMSHAWPHGNPGNGQPVDPAADPYAPDIPAETYRFFLSHRMPASPRQPTCR